MAAEQQIIFRLNGESVAHEGAGVEDQGASHAAGYAMSSCHVRQPPVMETCAPRWQLVGLRGSVHLGIFLRVQYGCDGDAEVGDWAPEICRERKRNETVSR